MDQHTPPSPSPSNGTYGADELPYDLDELVQHNSITSYPNDHLLMDTIQVQTHSRPASQYGTPAPEAKGYEQPSMQRYYTPGYSQQPYSHESTPLYDRYQDEIQISGSHHYSTPATSPPSPLPMITRSGKRLTHTAEERYSNKRSAAQRKKNKANVSKNGQPKKNSKEVAAKLQAIMTEPLSMISKTFQKQMKMTEEYVQRSMNERHAEIQTGKNPGKVKRPMNAFMLYRKAFNADAKDWSNMGDHQILSQFCGGSWRVEKAPIKEKFTLWASMERDAHRKAFPDYKFKPGKSTKGRRGAARDEHEEEEDEIILNTEWDQTPYDSRSRTMTSDRNPDEGNIPDGHHATYMSHPGYGHPVMHQQMVTPGHHGYPYHTPVKPMPAPPGTMYYHQNHQLMHRTPSPAMSSYPPPPPQQHSMYHPQGAHMYDVGPQPHHGMQQMQMLPIEQRMDPNLFSPQQRQQLLQQQSQQQQQQQLFGTGIKEVGWNDAEHQYDDVFTPMDEILLPDADDDILKGAWQYQNLGNGDINSTEWLDPFEDVPAPGTVAPAATMKPQAGP